MKTLIPVCVLVGLSGCASTDYGAYVKAQSEANKMHIETQKPLVRIMAQPGQQITGLASIEVYSPSAAPVIQQARPNEWAGVMSHTLSVVGAVAGIKAAGKAAVNLSDSVGRAGTAGYSHVQAPGAVTTTTTNTGDNSGANSGNSGRLAGGSISDGTSTVGDNSGAKSGNSGRIAGGNVSDGTSTPTTTTTETSTNTTTSTVTTSGDTNSNNTTVPN